MNSKIQKIVTTAVLLSMAVFSFVAFAGCKDKDSKNEQTDRETTEQINDQNTGYEEQKQGSSSEKEEKDMTENPKVIITMTDGKTIKLELFPKIAPITVANFLSLVDEKYYDGLIFHRIIASFMIQGGGYYIEDGNRFCTAPSKTPIKGEFSSNGVNNTLSHDAGVISMARTNVKDSATGQFFICTNGRNKASLDGNYAAFGRTMDQESLDNVLAIASVQTVRMTSIGMDDFPYPEIPTIQSIRRLG